MASRSRSVDGFGPLITEAAPRSPASEAYRKLRTNIQFASLEKSYRTLAVTSATAAEGKTTTAANFGVVVAQAGTRVCLVDSDLRRPALHKMFGLGNERGLTTALLEGVPPTAYVQPSRVENLSVLTSGPLPPNPAEVIGSSRMRELLDTAAREFDLVVCDSPPILPVTDSLALAAMCDGVILVVAAGKVPADVVRRASDQIAAVRAQVVGVLLNRVNLRRDGYYYAGYYRYD